MVSNQTLSNYWKCLGALGFGGAVLSATASRYYPGETGSSMHNAYYFDDLFMEQLVFSASLALLFVSMLRVREISYSATAPSHNKRLLLISIGAAIVLLGAALYAFDNAFLGSIIFHKEHANAAPEGDLKKGLFCTLYSCVGVAGLSIMKLEHSHLNMSKHR